MWQALLYGAGEGAVFIVCPVEGKAFAGRLWGVQEDLDSVWNVSLENDPGHRLIGALVTRGGKIAQGRYPYLNYGNLGGDSLGKGGFFKWRRRGNFVRIARYEISNH